MRTLEIKRWINQYNELSVDDHALAASTQVLESTRITGEGVGDEEVATSADVFCPSQLSSIMERAQHYLEQSLTSCHIDG